VGARRLLAPFFALVTMSTPEVLGDTLAIAQADGISHKLLSPLYDVDTPEDLSRLRSDFAHLSSSVARHISGVSSVLPTIVNVASLGRELFSYS